MRVEILYGGSGVGSSETEGADSLTRRLAGEARRLRALAALRRLLELGAADAPLDEELAELCSSFGFAELGVGFAERAAAALGATGNEDRASEVLRAAEELATAGGARTLERLAAAYAQLGRAAESARLLVKAAASAREEGALLRAVQFCSRASSLAPGVAALHREWGLALLAANDAAGARGHFERWSEEQPDCVEAAFWTRESALRGLPSAPVSFLECRAGESPLEPAQLAGSDAKRRVLVLGDAVRCLSEIEASLVRWNVELCALRITAQPDVTACESFDLVVVPLPASVELARLRLEWLRCIPAFAGIPFLGAVRREPVSLARAALRDLGVVGLLDRDAKRDEVAFRVVLALGLEGTADRARVRVPADFPVELESLGRVTRARAENLSRSGIRLRDERALAPNERVFVRFLLGTESVALEGRVIHCHPAPEGSGHVIGIFFFSIEPRPRQLLEREIERRLTVRCAPEGTGSANAEG